MVWKEHRPPGQPDKQLTREIARYVRAAGVDRALDQFSGPFGVRRYIVRFERQGAGVRLTRVDAMPLAWGGGPPPEDPSGQQRHAVERALTQLHRNMATSMPWDVGACCYVRDLRGRVTLIPLFGHEAEAVVISQLPVPGPPGHPLESPEYLRLVDQWASRMLQVQARTQAVADDWDEWEILDDTRLLLHFDMQGPRPETRSHRCRVLATFEPHKRLFSWRTAAPPFAEAVFQARHFSADYGAATEVGLLTATRLRAAWLFVQPYDERGSLLMAAVNPG